MPRWARLLLDLPPIALAISVLVLLWQTVAPRRVHPYDLEWMEGGMLVHVWRLQQDLALYLAPSSDWIPYIYPPLYPWLLSLMGDPSYATARGLSFAATLACGLAALVAVRREGVSWGMAAVAAAGFWIAYDVTGAFFDLARNDTLALALSGWALVVGRRGTRKSIVIAGILLFLAFTAKQNYALLGLPMVFWIARRRGRSEALAFVLASAGPALLWTLWMHLSTEGVFLKYLLGVPGSHPLVGRRAWPLAERELWEALAMLNAGALIAALTLMRERSLSWAGATVATVLLALGWLGNQVGGIRKMALEVLPSGSVSWIALLLVVLAALGLLVTFWRRERSEGASWWVGALLVLVPLTVLMRAHHGGFMNVLMPGIWVLSIVGVLAVHTLGRQHPVLAVLGVVLACGPLVQGRWDPARYAPTEGDVVAMDTLLEAVQGIEGEVLVPHAPWLPVQAGKSPSFPLISLWDVDHYRSPFREEVRTLDKAFADQRWAAIMIANKVLAHGMKKHYRKVRKIKLQAKDGVPKTGWKVRPQWIWEPISRPGADQPADAADPEVLPDGSEGPGADEG